MMTMVPMNVTLLGIVTDTNDEHWKNAFEPMNVTLLGIEIEVSDVHLENASLPMDVTLGIVTETSDVHP